MACSLHQAPFDPALLRELDGRLVGFKLGYAMTESRYYSWLGGVHPSARGSGVARQLMRHQHRWLQERGCMQVDTSTDQGNAAMARVNQQEGFTVCGTRCTPGRLQVLYLKVLT
jgi:predicted GNAT superfamily acetyltransferase